MVTVPTDYPVLLLPLSRSIAVLNSCFVTATWKDIEGFDSTMTAGGVVEETVSLCSFQMNHHWTIYSKTAEVKRKLLAAREPLFKHKICFILDPGKTELCLKLLWLPHPIADDIIRRALEGFGLVKVPSEDWRVEGFQGIEFPTRIVRMKLNYRTGLLSLLHQLQLFGGRAVVSVAGRFPTCLHCRRAGHVRKDFVVPKCESCHQFGHVEDDCVRTYASNAAGVPSPPVHDLLMDEEETEVT